MMNFVNDELRDLVNRAEWQGVDISDVQHGIKVWSRVHREATKWGWTETLNDCRKARKHLIRELCNRVYG